MGFSTGYDPFDDYIGGKDQEQQSRRTGAASSFSDGGGDAGQWSDVYVDRCLTTAIPTTAKPSLKGAWPGTRRFGKTSADFHMGIRCKRAQRIRQFRLISSMTGRVAKGLKMQATG
jgi:hypothetical protein